MTDEHIISDSPFKGRKIELADTTYVSIFDAIAEEFMRVVFEMEPEDYLITDESTLSDFICFFDGNMAPVYKRIGGAYGLAEADLSSENLHEIFAVVHKMKFGNPA